MERVLRAEQLQTTFKRGWLLVTERRLVFSDKDRLGAKEHWSVPLSRVESAIAQNDLGHGMHKFVIRFRDEHGKHQRHELKKVDVVKGFLLGPLSKIGNNPLLRLEQAVQDAIRRAEGARPVAAPGPNLAPAQAGHRDLDAPAFMRRTGEFRAEQALARAAHKDTNEEGPRSAGIAAELARLAELRASGSLSDEEFAAAKRRLLGLPER